MNAAKNLKIYEPELFPELVPSMRPASGELQALDAPLAQFAPGVWVSGMPAFELPTHVLCRLVPGEAPGTFTLEPEGSYPGFVRMGTDIGNRLGVIGLSDTTLRRLIWGGFIDHIRPAPGCIFISIESLLEHFRRTAADCVKEESYWTKKRQDAWRQTCEGISNND